MAYSPDALTHAAMTPRYAELHCLSNFSFLRGASHPQELVRQAHTLGYQALALTDECSLAGVVRAHQQAQQLGLHLILGSELRCADGLQLVLLVPDCSAYAQLCRLITRGRRRARKGQYHIEREDLLAAPDCLALFLPQAADSDTRQLEQARWLRQHFPARLWSAVELHCGPDDPAQLQRAQALSQRSDVPLVACGDVHMHVRSRRPLQDTLCAIRHACTLTQAGHRLFANGERHLRPLSTLQRIYPEALLRESLQIARRCRFSLQELHYRYPAESVPSGLTASQHLRTLTEQGLQQRWPGGTPEAVRRLIEHELQLITELKYEHYFLTVHEIVQWARARGILCQGRGSAANSCVCFALGITAVDPADMKVSPLFERFMSRERNEPPDIDIDFEHQRREEVIQHIYARYGRDRAAIAATVIRYQSRSALRDVGKALGLSLQDVDRISKTLAWWDDQDSLPERLRELDYDPDAPVLQQLQTLVRELIGFPRHLSQHVGGFVISDQALEALVPIENAAMPDRTILQWDKDDLDALGLLKIDCLALGMLTAIRKSFDLLQKHKGMVLDIDRIRRGEKARPDEARKVYAMLQRADSVGVFQVESRAQMSMLPRLRPQEFYDLVIETAIVRPGPIQGGMVHPYLNRRMGREPVRYPARLRRILERTLGIPIFQEQVMEICVEAAGFSPGEADQVRRSMAAWRRTGSLEKFESRLKQGMAKRGYDAAFAEQIHQQIQGFAEYGFPESHAASFAVLVYVSAWLKCFQPAAFLTSLLNSQPMGFYSPSQLIQDARRHGVEVRGADVSFSDWESTLEAEPGRNPSVRLGLNRIKGLSHDCGQRIVHARPCASISALNRNARIDRSDRQLLAEAGALRSLAGNRHQAHWQTQGSESPTALELDMRVKETATLRRPTTSDNLLADYRRLGYTLGRHPICLLRARLSALGCLSARQSRSMPHLSPCRIGGLVSNRQRPGTAQGIIFMTLEDETGNSNLIIKPEILVSQRRAVLHSRLLIAAGVLENRDGVQHLIVESLQDQDEWVDQLSLHSRDFH